MFPPSDFRFRAGIAIVAIATIFVGLAIWRSWPDSTEDEFTRAAHALARVRSFRYEYADLAGARPNREAREIACPSRQRLTIASASGDGGTWEYLFVDGQSFHSTPQSGGWKEYSNEFGLELGLNPRILCDKLAGGETPGPFPPFATLLKRGFATRGEIKQVESGAQCREWTVKVPRMGLADDSESFCLDVTTGLPLYRLTASGRYAFSDFNVPLAIEVPRFVPASH